VDYFMIEFVQDNKAAYERDLPSQHACFCRMGQYRSEEITTLLSWFFLSCSKENILIAHFLCQ
jgi:hypothetical protein